MLLGSWASHTIEEISKIAAFMNGTSFPLICNGAVRQDCCYISNWMRVMWYIFEDKGTYRDLRVWTVYIIRLRSYWQRRYEHADFPFLFIVSLSYHSHQRPFADMAGVFALKSRRLGLSWPHSALIQACLIATSDYGVVPLRHWQDTSSPSSTIMRVRNDVAVYLNHVT
jgi:hypothetical protein